MSLKNKRKLILLLAINLISRVYSFGQQVEGFFTTSEHFKRNYLSISKRNNKKTKIKLNDFLEEDYITVKSNDTVVHLSKDSIYGYRCKTGETYRFYKGKTYEILNQGEDILLYQFEQISTYSKNPYKKIEYFFSKEYHTDLIPLTLSNLNKNFTDSRTFMMFLELYFKFDYDLTEYDFEHRKYKINRILELSNLNDNAQNSLIK